MYANTQQTAQSHSIDQSYQLASPATQMHDLSIGTSPYSTALVPVQMPALDNPSSKVPTLDILPIQVSTSTQAMATTGRYSPLHKRGLSPVSSTSTTVQMQSPRLAMARTVTQTSTQMQSGNLQQSIHLQPSGHLQPGGSSYSQSMPMPVQSVPQNIPEPSAVFTLCPYGLNCHFKDKCKSFHPEKIGVCPLYIYNTICMSGDRCALEHPTMYGDNYILKTGQCFRVIRPVRPVRQAGPAGHAENKTAQMQPMHTAKYSAKAPQNKPVKIYQSFLLEGNAINAAIGKGLAGDTSDLLFQKSKGIDRQGKIGRQKAYLIEQLQRLVQDEENLAKQMTLIDNMLNMISNSEIANAINQSNLSHTGQTGQQSQDSAN